jgi:glycosyltransferase involved in cell wall biosynthesis
MTRPRVLVLTTYYHPVLGGAETNAKQLACGLHRRGFPVQVVTKRVSPDLPVHDVVEGVPVTRLRPVGERKGAGKWRFLPFAFAELVARRATYDVICCVDYRGIGIAAIAAGGLLHRPVLVQAETIGVLSCSGWDLALAAKGVNPNSRVVALAKWPVRSIYARADHFLCIAREIESEAAAEGISRDRVHYMPHAVDMQRFRPATPEEKASIRKEEGWPLDRLICMSVGRLSIEKGTLDLIEAWRQLAASNAVLVAVGPDMPTHPWDAGPRARQMVAEAGLGDRVIFHGASADPSRLLRAADVFIQPSHFEAFGISVVEAMATGLAVVATDVGGMRDFLKDDENALLCPPKTPAAIAERLSRLLADPPARERLGRAARATAAREFDEQVLFDRYAAIVEQAAASSPRSA